ncbi:MAG: nuclear transport factor 2 family protein [Aquabacterium sp.]|uniref:nuclear transport factor 2 family protein n=1 Tax=Aquabacterium sp. TaxID=1872578 RepID=UPI001218332D|nr:nuclear transport factor 2 family protein [Aquabacterium sp.]TAK95955.1 MAG: nuclear transport factor 2 family protein [Aquabacterium sp.]
MKQDLPPAVQDVIAFYESLSPASLDTLGQLYAPDARFQDPFNDVSGLAAIRHIFAHMFTTVQQPRFKVLGAMAQGQEAWLRWDFSLQRQGTDLVIHGATRLVFDEAGRVTLHRDYWDPAQELYAKVPLLGTLVRWLTRRLSASHAQAATGPSHH